MVLLGCFLGLVLQLLLGNLPTYLLLPLMHLCLFNCWNRLNEMGGLVNLLMCRPVMLLDGCI
jgi:hypothetical protein